MQRSYEAVDFVASLPGGIGYPLDTSRTAA